MYETCQNNGDNVFIFPENCGKLMVYFKNKSGFQMSKGYFPYTIQCTTEDHRRRSIMLNFSTSDLLLSLADILKGSRVETTCVSKALELICKSTSWNCGLIYEATVSGQFCLSEHYSSYDMTLLECISGDELTKQEYTFLSSGGIFPIEKGANNTPLELRLLELYATDKMILSPVLDQNADLYGWVVLFGETSGCSCHDLELGTLSVALSMLVRYIGVRMFTRKLDQTKTTMESILDNTGIDIYVNDFYTHEILYVNKSMAAPYGGLTEFMGRTCWETLFPGQNGPCEFCPQNKLLDEDGLPTKVYTWDYQRLFDGSWFRVFSGVFKWIDGRLAHVVSSADITDNKRNEALIENMANYDQLTKLPNRRMLEKECERRINKSTAAEHGYILFFDIDGFKEINDNYGHDAGDEFLIQLGTFFSEIPLLKDSIYRNGGDEFVAVLGGETISKEHIKSLANFIHERFRKPWVLKKGDIFCNTSIGVACYPEDGDTADALIQKADMAMYQVKKSGGGSLCFGYQMSTDQQSK